MGLDAAQLLVLVLAVLCLAAMLVFAIRRLVEIRSEVEANGKRLDDLGNQDEVEREEFREAVFSRLEDLERGLDRIRTAVTDIGKRESPPAPALRVAEEVEPLLRDVVEVLEVRIRELCSSFRGPRQEGVREALERVLGERGFRSLVVVEGPVPDEDRFRFVVEASRDGMTYKGPVWMRGTLVEEQRLSPSYPMFP